MGDELADYAARNYGFYGSAQLTRRLMGDIARGAPLTATLNPTRLPPDLTVPPVLPSGNVLR